MGVIEGLNTRLRKNMIYVTKIYHRKDTNIMWYERSSEYAIHLKENFLDNKRIVRFVSEESKDKLSLVTLTVFADRESFDEFQNDRICIEHMTLRNDYYSKFEIINEYPIIIEK